MTELVLQRYEALAGILKSIAHPSRLVILEALSNKSHCVSELQEIIGADTSTVSKHLLVMKNAGVISSDKRGNKVYYMLKTPCILKFMGCVESVIEQDSQNKLESLFNKSDSPVALKEH